jgi:hypothetical protein
MWMVAAMVFVLGLVWLYADFVDATPNESRGKRDRTGRPPVP